MKTIDSECHAGELRASPSGCIYRLVAETENFACSGDEQWPLWLATLEGFRPGSPAESDPIHRARIGWIRQIDARSMPVVRE